MNTYTELNKIAKSLSSFVYKNDPIKEHMNWNGLPVAIEWKNGETRQYPGEPWKNLMQADYGYIKNTDSQDGEELDVYVKPGSKAKTCYLLSQLNPNDGTFDEFKYMLGFDSAEEAEECYKKSMDPEMFGGINEVAWQSFINDHFKFYDIGNVEKSLKGVISGTKNAVWKNIYTDKVDLVSLVKQVSAEEIGMGVKHEMEHTDNPMDALKTALDHLAENKEYYTKLKELKL